MNNVENQTKKDTVKLTPIKVSAKTNEKTYQVWQLEQDILNKEGVRVVIRAPARLRLKGLSYTDTYNNAVAGNKRITSLVKRIGAVLDRLQNANVRGYLATIPPAEITFDIVDGVGNYPNGGQRMSTVRNSYICN